MTATAKQGRPASERARSTTFGRHLIDSDIAFNRAAEELDVHKVYVSQLAAGDKFPSAQMMWAIEEWSEGAVTMQSWFEEE
jgi:hypothetical protein